MAKEDNKQKEEKKSKRKLIRIIHPHKNKSRKVELKNFMKKDFKKIEKYALDMNMLMVNAEKEKMFENVYAVAHAQVIKKPLAFFILNRNNRRIANNFGDFIEKYGPIIMNPEITRHSSTTQMMMEGCLSFPGNQMTSVDRFYKVTVKFNYLKFGEDGKVSGVSEGEYETKGFFAQLFQHEIDHINGINIY